MKNKKSQASMEFIISYGWTIIAVLIMVGTFSHLSGGSLFNFTPKRCSIEQGFNCYDFIADSSGLIQLSIINVEGEDIKNVIVNVSNQGCVADSGVLNFKEGSRKIFNVKCANMEGKEKERVKETINIIYESESGIIHSRKGEIITTITKHQQSNYPTIMEWSVNGISELNNLVFNLGDELNFYFNVHDLDYPFNLHFWFAGNMVNTGSYTGNVDFCSDYSNPGSSEWICLVDYPIPCETCNFDIYINNIGSPTSSGQYYYEIGLDDFVTGAPEHTIFGLNIEFTNGGDGDETENGTQSN